MEASLADMAARKTRDELIAEARRKAVVVRRRRDAYEDAQSELVEILIAARAADPPATLAELAAATTLTRGRVQQLTAQ